MRSHQGEENVFVLGQESTSVLSHEAEQVVEVKLKRHPGLLHGLACCRRNGSWRQGGGWRSAGGAFTGWPHRFLQKTIMILAQPNCEKISQLSSSPPPWATGSWGHYQGLLAGCPGLFVFFLGSNSFWVWHLNYAHFFKKSCLSLSRSPAPSRKSMSVPSSPRLRAWFDSPEPKIPYIIPKSRKIWPQKIFSIFSFPLICASPLFLIWPATLQWSLGISVMLNPILLKPASPLITLLLLQYISTTTSLGVLDPLSLAFGQGIT